WFWGLHQEGHYYLDSPDPIRPRTPRCPGTPGSPLRPGCPDHRSDYLSAAPDRSPVSDPLLAPRRGHLDLSRQAPGPVLAHPPSLLRRTDRPAPHLDPPVRHPVGPAPRHHPPGRRPHRRPRADLPDSSHHLNP